MTQDETIELARQAGAMFDHMAWVERDLLPVFERFAKLVAEKEREACWDIVGIALLGSDRELTKRVAAAIRARGQA